MATLPASRHPTRADAGIEAIRPAELLRLRQEQVDRIRLTFGLDRADFASDVLPAIEAYARFVHLLPAAATGRFEHQGGLLELGLEVGFHALQGTDAHIFSGQSSISIRRNLEPRWRHATFLAGLFCELHQPLTSLVVSDARGHEWPAYRTSLSDWLEATGAGHYFVRRVPAATQARGTALFALPQVLAASTLQYLDHGHSTIVPHLLASIAGLPVYREHNVLDGLVRKSYSMVIGPDIAPPESENTVVAVKLASEALLRDHDEARQVANNRSPAVPAPVPGRQQVSAPRTEPAAARDNASQLSLLDTEVARDAPPPSAAPPMAGSILPGLALRVPLRLHPLVREALTSIVDTMNRPGPNAAACTVSTGVFVPLAELELRGVAPALAIRALADLDLLVRDPSGAPTIRHDLGQQQRLGLVLDPRCVAGLDPSTFVLPTATGHG
jgi:hypothetical protein